MGKIQVLDDHTINQIAAGEVIERPASVVKELVENSLDAKAKNIWIRIEEGGTSLVMVRDDGEGMDTEDAKLAFQKHSTSKIRSFDDLQDVNTSGFRGEALPSIASVSRLRVTTCRKGNNVGTRITIEGNNNLEVEEKVTYFSLSSSDNNIDELKFSSSSIPNASVFKILSCGVGPNDTISGIERLVKYDGFNSINQTILGERKL